MKKIAFSLAAASALLPFFANAAGSAAEELEQKLSERFAAVYPGIEVKENAGTMEVLLPEVETVDFRFNDKGEIEEVKSTIPAVTMKVVEDGAFNGHPRYKLSTDSTARFKAVVYSSFGLQGIDVGSYEENLYFVPAVNTVSSHNFAAGRISLSETDSSTGAKEETAAVSSLKMNMDWAPSGGDLSYKILWQVSDAVFNSPLASVKVPSAASEMSAVYEDKKIQDYQKLLTDMSALKSSKSSFSAENVGIEVMGSAVAFNVKSGGLAVRDDAAGSFTIKADSLVDNIRAEALAGFDLREVKVKYLLKGISVENVKKLTALQEKAMEIESKASDTDDDAADADTDTDEEKLSPEEEAFAREAVAIAEDILKTAEYKMRMTLVFDDADATFLLALKKSGDYVVGNGKVTLVNFDKIVPDYTKQCETERKANPDSFPEVCMKAGMSEMVRGYVDTSRRKTNGKGQTVDEIDIVLNETGVYVGGDKVADAVEFNLSQMLAEYMTKQPLSLDATEAAVESPLDAEE